MTQRVALKGFSGGKHFLFETSCDKKKTASIR